MFYVATTWIIKGNWNTIVDNSLEIYLYEKKAIKLTLKTHKVFYAFIFEKTYA